MPWPYAPDESGRSPAREKVIAETKLYWAYESPWPDYELIDDAAARRDVYGKLRIRYDESLDALKQMVERYLPEWNPATEDDGVRFCKTPTINLSFPEYDAFILYGMVRRFQPRQIVELGSGMSTRVLLEAGSRNDTPPAITCVDKYALPKTKSVLGSLGVTYLDEDITQADMALYDRLGPDDILFIDSSHVLKNFGDVELEFMSILPSLKPGVIVHVHDIFLPHNYPIQWLLQWKCVLTEQQVLGAYLHDNDKVQILAANMYNLSRGICVPDEIEFKAGGSFWFKIK